MTRQFQASFPRFTNPAGESNDGALRLDFDRRLMLHFRGSVVTSDAGLLAYRELDDALGLTTTAGEMLADACTSKNGRHALVGLLRQSVFGRLAGYEDVNDAERLRHDPTMRWIVGGKAASDAAASPSQMGRFETRWLTGKRTFRRSLIFPANGSIEFTVAVRLCRVPDGGGRHSQNFVRLHSAADRGTAATARYIHSIRLSICHAFHSNHGGGVSLMTANAIFLALGMASARPDT
jgi:hypothetical protein